VVVYAGTDVGLVWTFEFLKPTYMSTGAQYTVMVPTAHLQCQGECAFSFSTHASWIREADPFDWDASIVLAYNGNCSPSLQESLQSS
jgi:hypothetical protein